MKTKKHQKKLMLNKATVSSLDKLDLGNVRGGGSNYFTCTPCDTLWQTCLPCPFRESFGTAC